MIKTLISLQDLRRKVYLKAKTEGTWKFWGLYVHVCRLDTLYEAYREAKKNNGAPGIDGVTFEQIEKEGVKKFLVEIREQLISGHYLPLRNRMREIPKGKGKVRVLGIPTIRDRVVQGALKLILEPVFEADFQDGSYGYRPKRTAHEAVDRVASAVVYGKSRVIDLDLSSYFDNVRHSILLQKVACRVNDSKIMRLLKLILKASGKKGVPQGGVLSPLLSNIYLNEVDRMLEKAKRVTRRGKYTQIEYARFADDIVVLVDGHRNSNWIYERAKKRLYEELQKLEVKVNQEKTRQIDLMKGETFDFLGFTYMRWKTLKGKWGVRYFPRTQARTKLLRKLKKIFRRFKSQPVQRAITLINPILRGWVNYFRIGNSNRCFEYIQNWVELKVRRHIKHARKHSSIGWKRWSSKRLHDSLWLYSDYKVKYLNLRKRSWLISPINL